MPKTINTYLLTNVVSATENPLHRSLVGRLCHVDYIMEGNCCFFYVELDDGKEHLIRTTPVKDWSVADETGDMTVTTQNSVYTFAYVKSEEAKDTRKGVCGDGCEACD